ncbi:MAG: 2TM domain-containing protein [Geminocystis sp.]|nr:2TM domain-containing protein [Geminocystis sp.]HIK38091.1 2TM domain-containing protein [Geminocystis sp. M7585_C2015_104]MCS7149051.1 2TM domain-containing protein [Geminocystis sp.]MCX8077760.1 2TM domain-containing protein [Geminocystis sp.]MDW8117128.1 2TM domain-containing protein [Geminocystis sp.]
MPPRWPRKPDRKNDPAYRKLDDRMNFAVHTALFLAVNSGVWFFHNLNHPEWAWTTPFTLGWSVILGLHLLYIGFLADYSH